VKKWKLSTTVCVVETIIYSNFCHATVVGPGPNSESKTYTVFVYTCSEIYQTGTAGTTQAEFIITYRGHRKVLLDATNARVYTCGKVDNSINSWRRSYLTACTLNIKKRWPAARCTLYLYYYYYYYYISMLYIYINVKGWW